MSRILRTAVALPSTKVAEPDKWIAAPAKLGSRKHMPLGAALGEHVHVKDQERIMATFTPVV